MKDIELPPLPEYSELGENYGYTAEDMQAYARAAVEANSVPDGWKPVPVEPTKEMLDASALDDQMNTGSIRAAWKDMVEAAPALSASPAPAQQIASVDTASLQCGCGDIFPAAQFNDGHCPNCWAGICASQQERKPMTDEEIRAAVISAGMMFTYPDLRIARAVERHHGIEE